MEERWVLDARENGIMAWTMEKNNAPALSCKIIQPDSIVANTTMQTTLLERGRRKNYIILLLLNVRWTDIYICIFK